MFQIKVIDRVSKTEQGVIGYVETLSLVCCFGIVVIKIN
jgi:hypothetical protein